MIGIDERCFDVAIEIPDLSPHEEGSGEIPYYYSFAAAAPGPHLWINALTHGNEVSGAIAVDHLLRSGFRPRRGRLSVGFANVEAYAQFDSSQPSASRYVVEDLNRVWSEGALVSDRRTPERRRARQMRALADRADYLLDLHSMQYCSVPLMLAGTRRKGLELAKAIGFPQFIVRDAGHANGLRLRDYGPFSDPTSPKTALLLECGLHWQERSVTVALEGIYRFLMHFGMATTDEADPYLQPIAGRQIIVEVTEVVTMESERFDFFDIFNGMEVLGAAGTPYARDGDRILVTPYDRCYLVMPSHHPQRGHTAVRLGRQVA